jgi:hypothetical protein
MEGALLAGQYALHEWIGESETAAYFRVVQGSDGKPALVKLIPAEAVDGGRQLELWGRVSRLSHPHLMRLLDFGRSEDEALLYAAFEFPEDTLADAMKRSPLNEAEAREVRDAISGALRYIHSQGLVHTAVDAGNIVGVDNQVKLSSDVLCEAAMGGAAEDFRALDRLLPAPSVPQLVPSAPVVARAERHSFPWWIYAVAVVFFAGLGYLFLPKAAPPAAVPPAPAPASVASGAPARPPAAAPSPSSRAKVATSIDEYWRVIAFTYNSRQSAQHRVDGINRKWPGARAEVFTPIAGRSPFLVALGGHMNRDEAVRLLKMARGKGLPRDTYIQNYSR